MSVKNDQILALNNLNTHLISSICSMLHCYLIKGWRIRHWFHNNIFFSQNESTEPIDAVNYVSREIRTHDLDNSPSTTSDIDATNCATKTEVQVPLILTTTKAVHVVYWFFFNGWHLFSSQMKALWTQRTMEIR